MVRRKVTKIARTFDDVINPEPAAEKPKKAKSKARKLAESQVAMKHGIKKFRHVKNGRITTLVNMIYFIYAY